MLQEFVYRGTPFAYHDQGQGTPLVLVHAFPLSSAMWQPQRDALATRYRLILPDLPGFGASPLGSATPDMDFYADAIVSLLDALQLDRVALGGLSMGGYISFAFLRRYANRLRALILSDTKATIDSEEARQGRETNARLAEQEGASAIADKMIPGLVSPQASPELKAQLRQIIEANPPAGIAAALRAMMVRPDSTPLLTTIAVPTLVIVGSEDQLTSPDSARAMADLIPHAHFAEIAGAGHIANLEAPAAFNAALMAFLP